VSIGNRRHGHQLVETLLKRILIIINCAVGKCSFRVGAQNDRSDEMVAEVAVCRISGHMEALHTPPSLHLLSAAALSKPRAVENLAVDLDLSSYNKDVTVITDTHFKLKHSDSAVAIDGYMMFRPDQHGRRARGVALYVRSNIQSSV
jgi:hypothetical protein